MRAYTHVGVMTFDCFMTGIVCGGGCFLGFIWGRFQLFCPELGYDLWLLYDWICLWWLFSGFHPKKVSTFVPKMRLWPLIALWLDLFVVVVVFWISAERVWIFLPVIPTITLGLLIVLWLDSFVCFLSFVRENSKVRPESGEFCAHNCSWAYNYTGIHAYSYNAVSPAIQTATRRL